MKYLSILLIMTAALCATGEESVLFDFGLVANDSTDPALAPRRWSSEQYLFTETDYGRPTRATEVSAYTVPADAPYRAGEAVFRLSGELTTSYPEAFIAPPVPIGARDSFLRRGLVRDIGAIRQVNLSICNLSEPVFVDILMSDERGNFFSTGFAADGPQGAWYTMTFENPSYFLELPFPEFRIPLLKLEGIRISSIAVQKYWKNRGDATVLLSEEERLRYERAHPVEPVTQPFAILVRDITVVHGESEL